MKAWQVGILVILGVSTFCVLAFVLFVVQGIFFPQLSPPPTPSPTSTAIPTPTAPPSPTPSPKPTSTATQARPRPTATRVIPLGPPADVIYLECYNEAHDALAALFDDMLAIGTDADLLCAEEPAASERVYRMRVDYATCANPEHPYLLIVDMYFDSALSAAATWLDDIAQFCDTLEPWWLDMASDDLDQLNYYLEEAHIQLVAYLSQ